MSFKKLYFFLFAIIAFSTIVPVFGFSSVTLRSINQQVEVTLTITDAYYTNLDNDEVYDIVALFDLNYNSNHQNVIKIDVYLTLPSGYVFSYKWIINNKLLKNSYQIHFFDHALESGFYNLTIRVKLLSGGVDTGVVDYEFDPPGGSGGGGPLAALV